MKEPVRIIIELIFAALFAATLTFLFYHAIRPAAVHALAVNGPRSAARLRRREEVPRFTDPPRSSTQTTTPPRKRGFFASAGVRRDGSLVHKIHGPKPSDEGDRQGSPAVARVVVGKLARALAGRG